MPQLGGYKITHVGWAGRSSIYVDFDTSDSDLFAQLYCNRKLVGVTRSVVERRVIGQIWDGHISSPPVTLMLVEPDERMTDFGSLLEIKPWNRYSLAWSVPEEYDRDVHHFTVLYAEAHGVTPTIELARVPYVGPRTYSIELPGIPSLPLSQPVSITARNHWQNWVYRVIPHDNASPDGNAGSHTDVTIPALVYPNDLVIRDDGSRFTATVSGATLTIGYAVPA